MSLTGNATAKKVLRGRINRLDALCISAYSIAVKNGFTGTEEEWLASLKGEQGDPGVGGSGGGLTEEAAALLIKILRAGVYYSDQSANITALETALAETEDEPVAPDESETIYSVNNYLSKVTTSNSATSITEGSSYNAILTPATGYAISSVYVEMGGVDVTSSVYSDGVISIASVTGYINITAVAQAISYAVTNNLTEVTTNNNENTVSYGSAYTATLTPSSGYSLSSVTVTMGGVNITSSAYSNGKVTIGSVTGAIVITAVATEITEETVYYSVSNSLTNATSNNPAVSVEENSAYSAKITPSDGYELSDVTVTMGGTDVTDSVYSNGTITIASVAGNVVITAAATKIVQYYSVTYNLTNVTSSQNTPSISENTILYAKLTPDDGYELDTVLVTMGGVDVTSSVYSNGEVSVTPTGDIVITATAVEIESDEPTLLCHWDFTSETPLVDTVGGITATTDENVSFSTDGAYFANADSFIKMVATDTNLAGSTVEIEFGEMTGPASTNGRLLMAAPGETNSFTAGLFYSKNGYWTNATATATEFTDKTMFAKKRLLAKFSAPANSFDVYLEDTFVHTCTLAMTVGAISLGGWTSSYQGDQSYYTMYVKSVKIYREVA